MEVPFAASLTDIAGPDDIMKAARSVELAAYNTFQPETSTTYKQKMRSLFQNLKIKNNEQLRADVFSGVITPEKFGKSGEGISRSSFAGSDLSYILTKETVNMSGDDLKSAEKRAADAAMEKENMRVAMTATEMKAISTTYVLTSYPFQHHPSHRRRGKQQRDPILHPLLLCEWVRYGVFLAFNNKFPYLRSNPLTLSSTSQYDLRQVQAVQGRLHSSPDPRRRRADDDFLRVHELRQPLEVLLKQAREHVFEKRSV